MGSDGLTSEQKLIIERKRAEALKRLKSRQGSQSSSAAVLRSPNVSPGKQLVEKAKFSNKQKSVLGTASKKISIILTGEDTFRLVSSYDSKVIDICKTIPSRKYDMKTKSWSFSLTDYSDILYKLRKLKMEIEQIPIRLLIFFEKKNEVESISLEYLGEELSSMLMPFQVESIKFAIRNRGRILLADDMGLGKTLQALCIAYYYKAEWPLLIVCPSSLKSTWKESIHQWFPSILPSEVNVIYNLKDCGILSNILIISYDQLSKLLISNTKADYKVLIGDESHYLKNYKAARTKCFMQAACKAARVILLSGTPALSKPIELFPQMKVLQPSLFPKVHEFGVRYCEAKQTAFGWEYEGSRNIDELKFIMQAKLLIRRTKLEVMDELPSKSRKIIFLNSSMIDHALLKEAEAELCLKNNKTRLRSLMLQYFSLTAQAKSVAVCDYLQEILLMRKKFLVFAHHQHMILKICDFFEEMDVDYVKIDGSITAKQKERCLKRFKDEDETLAAVMSITSCSSGFNMTNASIVLFAELFWNPGLLAQAEDRVYRIGQKSTVNSIYLIGKRTSDDYMWPLIKRKLGILEGVGLASANLTNVGTIYADDSKNIDIEEVLEGLDGK